MPSAVARTSSARPPVLAADPDARLAGLVVSAVDEASRHLRTQLAGQIDHDAAEALRRIEQTLSATLTPPEEDALARFLRLLASWLRAGDADTARALAVEINGTARTLGDRIVRSRSDPLELAARLGLAVRAALAECLTELSPRWFDLRGRARAVRAALLTHQAIDAFAAGVVTAIAGSVAAAHERKIADLEVAAEQLQRIAVRDGKTGLLNHDHFRERFDQEMARARRYALPLTLLMADLDGFKAYNDSQGHLFGDRALALLAALIMQSARASDLVSRYGGEEFAVLLPQTDLAGGIARAERIRRAIEQAELPVRHPGPARVTISLGVAQFPLHGHSIGALIDAADAALYVAKRHGKNAVTVADAQHPRPGLDRAEGGGDEISAG